MKLPVSVVIPTIQSRAWFLRDRCLPSVEANGEVEIIVVEGDGNGSAKRNRGALLTTRPYLLFVDDDSILRPNCIQRMLDVISDASFAYSDFDRIVVPEIQSTLPAGRFTAGRFSLSKLRSINYINTTSLIRREDCPKWDEVLERFQDWDFWLTVVLSGKFGVYVPEVLYELWQIDLSVSDRIKSNPYIETIVKKHNLGT